MKIAFIGCAGNKLPANRIILSCYCYCAQIAGIKFGERKLRIHNIANVSKQKRKTTFFKQKEGKRGRERQRDREAERQRDRETERQKYRKRKRKKREGKGVFEGIPQIEKFVQNRMYCM